jgi:hypothetical protein
LVIENFPHFGYFPLKIKIIIAGIIRMQAIKKQIKSTLAK